jgi:endonuclease IV
VRSYAEKPDGAVVSIQPCVSHDSYIVNPCSPERTVVDAGEDYAAISPRSVALP